MRRHVNAREAHRKRAARVARDGVEQVQPLHARTKADVNDVHAWRRADRVQQRVIGGRVSKPDERRCRRQHLERLEHVARIARVHVEIAQAGGVAGKARLERRCKRPSQPVHGRPLSGSGGQQLVHG